MARSPAGAARGRRRPRAAPGKLRLGQPAKASLLRASASAERASNVSRSRFSSAAARPRTCVAVRSAASAASAGGSRWASCSRVAARRALRPSPSAGHRVAAPPRPPGASRRQPDDRARRQRSSTAHEHVVVPCSRCWHRGPTISATDAHGSGTSRAAVDSRPVALTIGIVGLPNVGKSTLFNALTKNDVLAANYPFATIEPNVGVVGVPDSAAGRARRAVRLGQGRAGHGVLRRHRRHRPGRVARARGWATSSWPTSARPTRSAR